MKKGLFVAASALLLAGAAHAQKKSAPPAPDDSVFSSESRLVLIDAVVTGKKGAYADDLSQKDFKVREDGKEQTLISFSRQADEAPAGERPCVVLLFDNVSVPQVLLHYAQDAAMKFLAGSVGRLTAIAEFDSTLRIRQNLTSDVESLKLAVNGVRSANGIGPPLLRIGAPPANLLSAALKSLAKGLGKAPGRKTIILFSQGVSVNADAMKSAVEECNRANAAVYPVDIGALASRSVGGTSLGDSSFSRLGTSPGGLIPLGARPNATVDLDTPLPASEALYALARGTGGFVVASLGRLEEQMSRIGSEQRKYYALGYLPSKEPAPGACRTIKVDVDRGGVTVRARTSYCDERTPELVTGTPSERDLEVRLNANAASTIPATMQTPFFYVAANTARVDLALDMPGTGVKFTRVSGKFAAAVSVIGIAYLPDNAVAARFSDTRKITLDDQKQVDEFAAQTYHYEKQFEMPSGVFDLKVALSSGPAGFAALELPLTIESWDPSKFALSALTLSQSARPAGSSGSGGDVDLFGDNVALIANGTQFIPAGTNRLRKTGKTFVYGETYVPAAGPVATAVPGKEESGLGVQMMLVNAGAANSFQQTGINGLKTETASGITKAPFGLALPVADLEPGAWTAEVIAQDGRGHRAVRKIDFVLVP